jgi:hypothetical protein
MEWIAMNLFRALLWIFGVLMALVSFLLGLLALNELKYNNTESARFILKRIQFLAFGAATFIGLAVML